MSGAGAAGRGRCLELGLVLPTWKRRWKNSQSQTRGFWRLLSGDLHRLLVSLIRHACLAVEYQAVCWVPGIQR